MKNSDAKVIYMINQSNWPAKIFTYNRFSLIVQCFIVVLGNTAALIHYELCGNMSKRSNIFCIDGKQNVQIRAQTKIAIEMRWKMLFVEYDCLMADHSNNPSHTYKWARRAIL